MKISKEMLTNGVNGMEISGEILCKSCSLTYGKYNKQLYTGDLVSEDTIAFKVQKSSEAFAFFYDNMPFNKVISITGNFNEFNGSKWINITKAEETVGMTFWDFLPMIKYNREDIWNSLKQSLPTIVSQKGMEIANAVLLENEEVAERFKIEFAAKYNHDNCIGGLLCHTYKVLRISSFILNTIYPDILHNDYDMHDLIYLGILFHDLGKIREMQFGEYMPESIVTHRYLSIEFLYPYKDRIVAAYSEEWWLKMVSILLQHHDEFEDKSRTLAAYLVHLFDNMDAQLTHMIELMERPTIDSSGSKILIDYEKKKWLNI